MGEARGKLQISDEVTASFDVLSQYLPRMTAHCRKVAISGNLATKLRHHYNGLTLPTFSHHNDAKKN
jgi:hypothetical protein